MVSLRWYSFDFSILFISVRALFSSVASVKTSNRIGLSEENWVLNYNYSDYCTLGTDNTSRCEDGHFKQAFRYGYYIDSINGENVQYGYIKLFHARFI